MPRRRNYDGDLVESLAGAPSGDMAHGWVYGVVGALVPAGIGVYDIVTRTGWTIGSAGRRLTFVRVEGPSAVWLGIVLVCFALVLHFHWFWGNHPKLGRYYEPAKFAAITAMFAALLFYLYYFIDFARIFR